MTQASTVPARGAERTHATEDAWRSARAAALAASTQICEIDEPVHLEAVSRLLSTVWNREATSPQVTAELLRALAMTGNYVAGAFVDSRLVGAAVAFFAAPPQTRIHSHITGVISTSAAKNVGFALKLHQRAWALDRGVDTITWTFDPLVRRNAYFNIVKLGVSAVDYLPNFYGSMHDPINAGDETDRLLVMWDLLAAPVVAACDGSPALERRDGHRPIPTVLEVDGDGAPVQSEWTGTHAVLQVPADIEAMRSMAPTLARTWRLALRAALGAAIADGAQVVGFRRGEGYVVESGSRHP